MLLFASVGSAAYGQTIFEEELRDGVAPSDWSITDVDFRATADGYALFETESSELASPSFDLSGVSSATLTFQVAKFGSGDDGPLTVDVSIDGGTTWDAQSYTSPTPTNSDYLEGELVLDATNVVGESDVAIRFTRGDSPTQKRLRDVLVVGPDGESIPPATDVSTIAELRNGTADGETRYRLTGEALVHFSDNFNTRRILTDGTAGIWSTDENDYLSGGTAIGDGITGLVGTLTINNSGALIIFELDEGSADATVSSTGNTIEPEVTAIADLSLEDTGKLVQIQSVTFQDTGVFETGENYTVVNGLGNELTFRTDFFDADYIGETIPTESVSITGYVGGFGSSAQITARSLADFTAAAALANLQIIHNSPDPAVESVDIFVNGDEFLTSIDYKTATAFTQVPAGVELSIEIAPAGAGIGAALPAIPVTLTDGESYIAVASGVVDPSGFSGAAGFSLELLSGAQLTAADENNVDVVVQHGSPDAPNVDIYLEQTGSDTPAIADLGYPDFSGYAALSPDNEVVGIAGAGGEILLEFSAPFATLDAAGAAVTVLASGFFDEANATEGNAFGLIAVLADGTVLELEEFVPSANLQIVHNSPDPAVQSVDIFVNGELTYEGVNFRDATPFGLVPSGVELSIEIAPAGAGIENALAPIPVTLTEDESYIAVASGVLDPANFTDASAFSLELFTGGKTMAADENGVEVNVHHGSPDAPNVDIYLEQTGTENPAVSDLAYPDFTGYVPLAANDELIGVAGAGGEVLLEIPAPLSAFTGDAIAVLASGFFNEANISDGNGFGLLVVEGDGTTTLLSAISEVTISEARAADEGTLVEITGIVNSNDFGFGVADYFVQDNTAGINITDFDTGGNQSGTVVAPGDSIRILGETAVFENQKNIEVSEFEILSNNNPLPEPQLITAAGYNAESDLQGSRVVLQNVTLTEASEADWPTGTVDTGSGVNVTFENTAGETFIIRIARNNSFYSSGSPVPNGPVNITGTLGQFGDDTQLFPFFEGDVAPVPTQVQIIHNSPDPAVASVDIYLDGTLTLEDVAFRSATGFIELPSNTGLDIGVTPTGQPLSSGVTFQNVFFDPGNYYVVASGVLDPSGFAPNPSGEDTDFFLDVIPNAATSAPDNDTFSFRINHGSPDAPAVDIFARDVTTLAEGVVFGTTTADYTNVPAASYTIDIAPAGDDVIASFEADANALGGKSALVLASGFLTPSANQDGEAFGALLVLADGSTALLPGVSTSIDDVSGMPQKFALEQNYPNPFNPTTQIEYALPEAASVQIAVFNIVGQRVATLLSNEQQSAGFYSIPFDASNLASGMYLYRIQAGNFIQTRKMTLIK
jgi:hypothetical protein